MKRMCRHRRRIAIPVLNFQNVGAPFGYDWRGEGVAVPSRPPILFWLFSDRTFVQFALQGSSMHVKGSGRSRNIPVMLHQHFL